MIDHREIKEKLESDDPITADERERLLLLILVSISKDLHTIKEMARRGGGL